ncbi:hypothetical protein [Vibrio penaeicida]|uniref:Uncharacterized protein n=1 Tax=Vibrio penaeicida TaxID=104609 RepID=A0AAV5NZR4_9VIBR|nr:hypothetical protein [Vibrio penaeicida]GLQ76063.1 hypothetical protein GCM10007932_54260 [Vibrio penaeicida]
MSHQRLHRWADEIMAEQPITGRCDYQIISPGQTNLIKMAITCESSATDLPIIPDVFESQETTTSVFHLYIGFSAVELLKTYYKNGNSAQDGTLYVEINEGDRFSDALFISAISGNNRAQQLLMSSKLAHLLPIFVRMFNGKSATSLLSLIGRSPEPKENEDSDFSDFIVESMESLVKALDSVSKDLASDLHAPKELWHPSERPADFNQTVKSAGESINNGITQLIAELQRVVIDVNQSVSSALGEFEVWANDAIDTIADLFIGFFDAVDERINAAKALMHSLTELITRFRNGISSFLALASSAINWLDTNRPDFSESIDTLVGYFSGLWDGIVDAILGFIDTISLVFHIIIALFKHGGKLHDVFELMLEIIDEFLAVLEKVPWGSLWQIITEDLYPEVRDFFIESTDELMFSIGDAISRTPAASGYYFGYLVYNLVEMFFPPMKFSKISGVANDAANLTSKFFKRMAG